MTDVPVDVVTDALVRRNDMAVGAMAVALLALAAVSWVVTGSMVPAAISTSWAIADLVLLAYFEHLRRPTRVQVTDGGLTLCFGHMRPRSVPWSRMSGACIVSRAGRRTDVPGRGRLTVKGSVAPYNVDASAIGGVVMAYEAVFGHPPAERGTADRCAFWEIGAP